MTHAPYFTNSCNAQLGFHDHPKAVVFACLRDSLVTDLNEKGIHCELRTDWCRRPVLWKNLGLCAIIPSSSVFVTSFLSKHGLRQRLELAICDPDYFVIAYRVPIIWAWQMCTYYFVPYLSPWQLKTDFRPKHVLGTTFLNLLLEHLLLLWPSTFEVPCLRTY